MLKTVDPTTFKGKPLYSKPCQLGQPDDYLVVCEGLTVGRIMKEQRASGRTTWMWTITGPIVANSNGEADTQAAAQKAVRVIFDRWLEAAVRGAGWYVG